jgi:hypothetical protein
MGPSRDRRPFDQVPPVVRFGMALVGLVVGLLLVFVGARSCEESFEDPPPTSVTTTDGRPSSN